MEEPGGSGKAPVSGRGQAGRRRSAEPLEVRIELVVVDGEAGKELLRRQGAVVREALQWFHDHPAGVERDASGTDRTD
jgi:hypothetical protein